MAGDFSGLQAAVDNAVLAAAKIEKTDDSAASILLAMGNAIKTAVESALKADATATQATIDTMKETVDTVVTRFVAADDKLVEAINTVPPAGSSKK